MYPPKVHQFAYVTDEACTEDEILSMEIIVMMVRGRFPRNVDWVLGAPPSHGALCCHRS